MGNINDNEEIFISSIPGEPSMLIGSAEEFENLIDVFDEKTGEYLYSKVR